MQLNLRTERRVWSSGEWIDQRRQSRVTQRIDLFTSIRCTIRFITYVACVCGCVGVWVGGWRQCHRSLGYIVRRFDAHRAYFDCHISRIPQTKQNRLINQSLVVERRENIAVRPTISFSSGKQLLKGRLFCILLKCAFANSMT